MKSNKENSTPLGLSDRKKDSGYTSGASIAGSPACTRNSPVGEMLKARFRCLRPMEDGRGQDRKESLGLTWVCCSIRKDMVCGKGAGALQFPGKGAECYPLSVFVSWADQDVETDQEEGKLPVVSM